MNLILIVQTPQDAADLMPSIAGLKALNINALWLIHSPAVLMDLTAADAETERQIAAINAAIAQCVAREDYTGAENYKQQRHALTLQKAAAATEGYKTMTPEQQEAATERIFSAFWKAQPAPKMSLTMHPQHHQHSEWIEMVNSMKGSWPAEMQHGHYVVGWPGQFIRVSAGMNWPKVAADVLQVAHPLQSKTSSTAVEPAAPSTPAVAKERKPKSGYLGHPRFKQLCSTGLDTLGEIALGYKINPNGMGRLKLAHAIGKHEESNQLLDLPRV